jgi:phosphoenolpyruvate phosphomutase
MNDTALRARPAETAATGKAARFRAMLGSPALNFLMEAHDGLSARIVEETGFDGIWASGLAMSAALGVRDNNEASWTQVLEVLDFMSDATRIPILLDGDTGYGNFNNFRRLVRKLCQREVAAVCIEDKVFPKTNSFIARAQPLADIEEFCGKIKAGKDSQTDECFSIIARIEALIAGWGMDEALRRAEAYHAAGADGILIHSKRQRPDEIQAFAREWAGRCPLVIVPTTYYATPTEAFREAGISIVIWANHNLRASLAAMRQVSRRIFEEESVLGIEGEIASVYDVFELAGDAELAAAERRYLAAAGGDRRTIILAASRGRQLRELTETRPKCMLDVRGRSLLSRLVQAFAERGVREPVVVAGHRQEAIDLPGIRKVINPDHETTGEAASLARAADALQGDCVISYGDILFRGYILDALYRAEGDAVIVVDADWRASRGARTKHTADLVQCSQPHRADAFDEQLIELRRIDAAIAPGQADGEWIGLLRLSPRGSGMVREELAALAAEGALDEAGLPDVLRRLIARGAAVRVVYVRGHWLDVNDAFDLAQARNFL